MLSRRSAVLACAIVWGVTAPARAQIYSWRDSRGMLVLSDKRPNDADALRSYEVPRSNDVRTTRVAAGNSRRDAYDDLIVEHASLNNVRQSLVRAVIQVESGFNPLALSDKGAMGLMQLMPATARQFGVKNPFNPRENVRAGVAYLRQLLDRYDNSEELALAAYNAGPGAVDRHNEEVPPFRETKNYVVKVSDIAGKDSGRDAASGGRTKLYRVLEVIDGREVVKYTDREPN